MAEIAKQSGIALEKAYQFMLWLMPTVEKFPRSQKFLLGNRMQGAALDILEGLVEATFTRNRSPVCAYPSRRFQRADGQPADPRRPRFGRRLCPGGAPAPRVAHRTAAGDERARRRAHGDPARRGGEDRRSAEMGPL